MCIQLSFEPLTIEKWGDFVSLFGERGACGGCWCMLWRLSRKEFESQKGDTNKLAMKTIVAAGKFQVSWSITTLRQLVGVHLHPGAGTLRY